MPKPGDAARSISARWNSLSTRGKVTVAVVLLIAGALAWYTFRNGIDALKFWNFNRKDAALEKTIQEDLKQAGQHGENANTARDQREVLESQYNEAQQRRTAAGAESQRSAEKLRAARDAYEKTLRTNPNDYDPGELTDDELCARLAKLDPPIPCR